MKYLPQSKANNGYTGHAGHMGVGGPDKNVYKIRPKTWVEQISRNISEAENERALKLKGDKRSLRALDGLNCLRMRQMLSWCEYLIQLRKF
jgi:hypothetical protein